MKYRIFWVDDSPRWIESIKDQIQDIFVTRHFSPEFQIFQTVTQAKEKLFEGHIDLFMVDCTLPDEQGDSFIHYIRSSKCFAYVLFYSQDASKLQLMHEDKHFIHVSNRGDVQDALEIIADQAYRSYRHPAFMRGLLLSEFIDLENLLEDIIVSCFRNEGDYFRKTIIGKEHFSLSAKCGFLSKLVNEAKESPVISAQISEIAPSGSQLEKMIEKRNILAHAHPEYNQQDGRIVLKSSKSPILFDENWFHETRELIHSHKNNLRRLLNLNLINYVNPSTVRGATEAVTR